MANKNSRNQTPPGSDANKLPGYELNNTTLEGWHTIHLTQKDVINAHLPIELCDSEHYIIGHLLITQGYNNDKLESHKTVGQTLIVSTCGTAPSIYRRSSTINNGVPSWSKWKSGESNSLTWKEASHIDMFTTPGVFNIEGKRINRNDGLPIYNTGTISARLVVLEGGNCITQVLTLLNTGGGDSNIYVRTKQDGAWKPWGKLQTNIEVGAIGLGQSRTFDDLTDNGIYSGVNVYATGTDTNGYPITSYETFVLVVINAYLTGGGITQLKYSLLLNGTTNVNTRTKLSGSWGNWVDLGAATTTDIQDNSITAQKLSTDVRSKVENPLRPLYIAAGAEYDEITGLYSLNSVTGLSESDIALSYSFKDVVYRLNISRVLQNIYSIKAFFPHRGTVQSQQVFKNAPLNGTGTFSATSLEIIRVNAATTNLNETNLTNILPCSGDVWSATFLNCSKLREVWPINVTNVPRFATDTFKGTPLLVELRLYGLSNNIEFSDSRVISKASILYIVNNAVPTTSAITITLHPDAYARLADDTDVVAALEAQPLVSLVSA